MIQGLMDPILRLLRLVEITEEFSEPWRIRHDYINQEKGGQRQEKDGNVYEKYSGADKDSLGGTHFLTPNTFIISVPKGEDLTVAQMQNASQVTGYLIKFTREIYEFFA